MEQWGPEAMFQVYNGLYNLYKDLIYPQPLFDLTGEGDGEFRR